MGLLHDLDDGKKREVAEEDFDYFLDVLPPVAFKFTWNGERWSFGFAEGDDFIYAFKKQGGKYYAQKTNLKNPYECGKSVEEQLQGLGQVPVPEKEETRAGSWIPIWITIGKQNPWIRNAGDPPFNTQSFCACLSDDDLLDKLERDNWCLGQAFYLGDLCFIQQVDGGGEWLTIKRNVPFESISFSRIIESEGRDAARALVARMRAATIERCRELDY